MANPVGIIQDNDFSFLTFSQSGNSSGENNNFWSKQCPPEEDGSTNPSKEPYLDNIVNPYPIEGIPYVIRARIFKGIRYNEKHRAEMLSATFTHNKSYDELEMYMAFSLYFDSNSYVHAPPGFYQVMHQIHLGSPLSPAISLRIYEDYFIIQIIRGDEYRYPHRTWVGNTVEMDRWHDFVFHFNLRKIETQDAYCRVWHDRELVLDYRPDNPEFDGESVGVGTVEDAITPSNGITHKVGMYFPSWGSGTDPALPESQTVYYGRSIIGDGSRPEVEMFEKLDRAGRRALSGINYTGYNLVISVAPENAGVVTDDGNFQEGEVIALSATPNPGYIFVYWMDSNNTILSYSQNFNFTMPGQNMSITAHFSVDNSNNPISRNIKATLVPESV